MDELRKTPNYAEQQFHLAIEQTWLAHDRTMLSWIRASLSLIMFGFGLHQVFRAVNQEHAYPDTRLLSIAMVVAGLLSLVLAAVQNRRSMTRLRLRYPAAQGFPEVPAPRVDSLALIAAALGLLSLSDLLFFP